MNEARKRRLICDPDDPCYYDHTCTNHQVLAEAERQTWNRTKPIDAKPACVGCGGPHPFDTTIPSPTWNRVIRGAGLPDYLCTTCIVKAFVEAGESFTAELWGRAFDGVPIELRVRSQDAQTAADLGTENTTFRARITVLESLAARAHALRCTCLPGAPDPRCVELWALVNGTPPAAMCAEATPDPLDGFRPGLER